MTTTFTTNPERELAHRVSGGLEIALYWNAEDDSTSVEVLDAATEVAIRFAVARERALDAFNHPFAHLQTTAGDAPVGQKLAD